MELTDLRVFLCVAEEGNMTQAAKRLGYVQSNVTARIQGLESELGLALFDRLPKGVTLTSKGNIFRSYALEIINLADEAIKAVSDQEEPSGELAIGVVETVASNKFVDVIAHFQSRYPLVNLVLQSGTSSELLAKISEGKLDGGFLSLEVDDKNYITEYEIQDGLFLFHGSTINRINIYKETWIVFPQGCPFRLLTEKWLQSNDSKPSNIIEVNTLETMMNAIRAGLGISLLPKSVIPIDEAQIKLHPVPEAYSSMTTRLVRRRNKYCPNALGAFAEVVRTYRL